MDILINYILPLVIGAFFDMLIGDPLCLPHPVVLFGKGISVSERFFNKGRYRFLKGMFTSLLLICAVFVITYLLICFSGKYKWIISSFVVFFSLSAKTLIKEVRNVFKKVKISVEEGRKAVSRIVGRDTSDLDGQQIRKAALETLSENLSDGVIAPLFWYLIAGAPGMLTYKMINTLDSMVGYKNERYMLYGRFAAKVDDVVNFIPARITAILMALCAMSVRSLHFIRKFGRAHTSPNAAYPEAALAGILDCRFGGPALYFGNYYEKPFIGYTDKIFDDSDLKKAVSVNVKSEIAMIVIMLSVYVAVILLCN